jgi:alpha-galactosidase
MKLQTISGMIVWLAGAFALGSCNRTVTIRSGSLQVEFDGNLYSRVTSLSPATGPFYKEYQLSEILKTKNFTTDAFRMTGISSRTVEGPFGKGEETLLKGTSGKGMVVVEKIVSATTFESFPDVMLFDVRYVNLGEQDLQVTGWQNHRYSILAQEESPGFWSFQGSSSAERTDWVLPLQPGFYKLNYMGMNQSDYGGGIPVTDLWRKDGGMAVGHLEMVPREVSLPVDFDRYAGFATVGIQKDYSEAVPFAVGDTLNTLSTFVLVHQGDYFSALRQYSELMQARGIEFAPPEEDAFESMWCGWGYERKFTTQDILQTLPKVKELGIRWVGIDDGYQIAEGDWRVDTRRFPGGSEDMKKMVDAIHAHGLKAMLWWAPLAADPGSRVLEEHPNAVLINEAGAPQYITWWDSYYLSPASQATLDYTLETVRMFMDAWGFDGLKLDGQHMNAVPADHNWERPLEYPEKSIEMLPGFFEMVYDAARKINPHAVIENCPCGTCMSFYNMPHTNQVVSSDPTSSWQIRHKGKTYKAIMPKTAYFGDHVELSDNGTDFASSFGVGAVLGTKFTWPRDNPEQGESQLLTPEREETWQHWFSLYHEKMLSKETYLGWLYDIGYDIPETHVIAKGDTLFYAFYHKDWNGAIELRGLDETRGYRALDYVNNRIIASFQGNEPVMEAVFKEYLLVAVFPEPPVIEQ